MEAVASRTSWQIFSQAIGKYAASRLRRLGILADAVDWTVKAEICERCPLRVVRCNQSYCGKPFAEQPFRDEATEGCGCPCREKAKTPREHCPLDRRHAPAQKLGSHCTCKWCANGA
jgi:hypothetical protein